MNQPRVITCQLVTLIILVVVLLAAYRPELAFDYVFLTSVFLVVGACLAAMLLLWERLTRELLPSPSPEPKLQVLPQRKSEVYPEFPAWLSVGRRVRMPNGVECVVYRVYDPSGSPSAVFEVIDNEPREYYRLEFGQYIIRVTPDSRPGRIGRIVDWPGWELGDLAVLEIMEQWPSHGVLRPPGDPRAIAP